MEEQIKENVSDFQKTRVVCRSGKPISMNDLKMVSLNESKSIIVLAPEASDPDAEVIKTVLAITNNPGRKDANYHIVAEINDPKNAGVCQMVGKDEIEVVLSADIIAKITAQTCRQSGLSLVYMNLLVYEGDELYFQPQPELIGKTYGESLFAYEDSSLFGLQKSDGSTLINPPMDTMIEDGDEVICISEDDDTIIINGKQFEINESIIKERIDIKETTETILILGWNKRGKLIVNELDAYVKKGSEITIVANIQNIEEQIRHEVGDLVNTKLHLFENDTTHRNVLESLGLTGFNYIILLSYSGTQKPEEADSTTLISLLHLRDIAEINDIDMNIVSEMLIDENRVLAEVTNADDFIVSEKVISLMLTQISEKKELSKVFSDIFQPEGSEIYIKPVTDYVETDVELDFYNVVESAKRKNETAIGYRLMKFERDSSNGYGVKVNPAKSNKIVFSPNDKIIVLAED
jgi:Trk K+ transport system NAD-binding subunit